MCFNRPSIFLCALLQPVIRIYDIPDHTFESDDEDESSSDDSEEESESEGTLDFMWLYLTFVILMFGTTLI